MSIPSEKVMTRNYFMTSNFYTKSNVSREFNLELKSDSNSIINVLTEKGHTVYSMDQRSNQLVPYHTHPSEEMVVLLEGSVRYIIEEEIVDLEEGDVIKIAAKSVHAMIGTDQKHSSRLLLIFI